MDPKVSTAILWGGLALILLGFGGCVTSCGTALSGAMNPSVYQTASGVATVLARGSALMMLAGFVAVLIGAIGKATYPFSSRDDAE